MHRSRLFEPHTSGDSDVDMVRIGKLNLRDIITFPVAVVRCTGGGVGLTKPRGDADEKQYP